MIGVAVMSLVLLGAAGLLIDAHLRAWRRVQADPPEEPGRMRLERGRFRRRMHAASLIAAAGALIAVWPLAPREPLWMIAFTLLLFVMALWMVGLAAVDAWASTNHYRKLRDISLAEQRKLAGQLERHKRASGRE